MHNVRKRVTHEFVSMVQIDSLSLKEEKFFSYLEKRLSSLPAEKEFQEYTIPETGSKSGNLIVRIPANTKRKKTVFFDSHVDTVEPGMGIKPIVKSDRVTSDGTTVLGSDDKAGAAAMIIAIEEITRSALPHGDLYFFFTSAEEIGLTGARYLDFRKIRADYGFILDSHGSVGGVIVAAPFHYNYEVTIKGRASHAGIAPEKGVSAIKAGGHIISSLPQGKVNKNTVSNVGMIEGGKATNIVPDECVIYGEFRSHTEKDIQEMKERIQGTIDKNRHRAVDIQLTFKEMYKGFSYSKEDPIIRLVSRAIREIGIKPRFERTGGGSNTNIYNQHKMASLTLSVGMDNVHSTDEFIMIDDLENLVHLILKIAEIA